MTETENFLHQVVKADAELFHSNMLAFLWNKYPELANRYLTGTYFTEIDCLKGKAARREKLDIDILIEAESKVLAIENKLKSRHTAEQLSKYLTRLKASFAQKEVRLLALCPTRIDAHRTSGFLRMGATEICFISYEEHVVSLLREAIVQAKTDNDDRAVMYLSDYLEIVNFFVGQCSEFESLHGRVGDLIDRINSNDEVKKLRLAPMLQRQVFERILEALREKITNDGADIHFKFNDVGIANRSKHGQITLYLARERIDRGFSLRFGVQLEGKSLRRSILVKKLDGLMLDEAGKHVVHEIANDLECAHTYFSGDCEGLVDTKRAKHFPFVGDPPLMAFRAYKNTESEFFIFREITNNMEALTVAGIADFLYAELQRQKRLTYDFDAKVVTI